MAQRYEPAFPLVDLVEHPDNPRRGDEAAIESSMVAHGFYGAVLVQASSGRLIAGNHRARVARRLGHATVPAIVLDVDDDQARRLLLVDNRTQDLAGYDDRALAAILASLEGDLAGTAFAEVDLDAALSRLEADPRNEVRDLLAGAEPTSDDYFTPAWLFEALDLLFDLDVASPPVAPPWIPARRRFTQADDGLTQPWEGRVWMNPPYSGVARWARRWHAHGNGVALLPFSSSSAMRALWADPAVTVVWPDREIRFVGGAIAWRVVLCAMSADCAAAVSRLGPARLVL